MEEEEGETARVVVVVVVKREAALVGRDAEGAVTLVRGATGLTELSFPFNELCFST